MRPFEPREDLGEELAKIVIPRRVRTRVRAELNRVGINYSTLFPDLDGIARHITWANTVLPDEEENDFEE